MGIEFTIDAEAGVIFSVATGHVDFAAFTRFRDQLRAHPQLRPGLYHLSDFRTANADLTGEQARVIAGWFEKSRKVTKMAYVTVSAHPFVRMAMGWAKDTKVIEIKPIYSSTFVICTG